MRYNPFHIRSRGRANNASADGEFPNHVKNSFQTLINGAFVKVLVCTVPLSVFTEGLDSGRIHQSQIQIKYDVLFHSFRTKLAGIVVSR